MASPFPGMDPYLEQFWRNVHASLIIYAARPIAGQVARRPAGTRGGTGGCRAGGRGAT